MSDANRLHANQPFDESLDVQDGESIASFNSPTPRNSLPSIQGNRMSDDENDGRPKTGFGRRQPVEDENPGEADPEEYDDEDDGSSTGEEESMNQSIEGAYDPKDYENLDVSAEIADMFKLITSYETHTIGLEYKLQPFIPEYMPSVGDLDAFLKVLRPDHVDDGLGSTILDEPCLQQSDPHILEMQLRSKTKNSSAQGDVAVRSIEATDHKQVDKWIGSIRELHREKPPASVHYSKNMPDVDVLMEEWPPGFEDVLRNIKLPGAELDCPLNTYVEIICGLLDIPIYKSRAQSLHVMFSLWSDFRNSQHFQERYQTHTE